MCELCKAWDFLNRCCMIHNTVPGGCKDFIYAFGVEAEVWKKFGIEIRPEDLKEYMND